MLLIRRCTSFYSSFALLAAAWFLAGCDNPPKEPVPPPKIEDNVKTPDVAPPPVTPAEPTPEEKAKAEEESKKAAASFKLGDMIKAFTPPTLEELDKQAEWEDRPLRDTMELRRKHDAEHPSSTTVSEALKLRNTSAENNQKILAGMGQLPSDDKAVNWEATINRHSAGDVNSTFPLFLSSTVEFDVNSLIGISLFAFDWNMDFFGDKTTIASWQTSKDRLYDKVTLRDDLTWSDGKPVTAHDVAYSFKLILTKSVPCLAVRSGTDEIKWVEAYDDQTVVFFHKASLVTNIQNMLFPIIPKHVYEPIMPTDPLLKSSQNAKLEDNPVVGGAYTISSRDRGLGIVLKRRESYYMHDGKQVRDKPHYETIRFRIQAYDTTALLALKAGDLDEMQLTPELWQNQTGGDDFYERNTKVYATEWGYYQIIWNTKDPLFEDKRVRWAMTYAFDHEEMLKVLLFGLCQPATGNFHPTSRFASKTPPAPIKQDLDKAEELLDEAGWKDSNNDGIRDKIIGGRRVDFDFTLMTSNRPLRIDICNLMKQCLQQIGIRCNVVALEFTALIDKETKHEFQAAMGGWGAGADPDTSENLFGTGKERNYGSYSNPTVDQLFLDGKREFDPEKRADIYRKIGDQLWEDQAYTYLYYQNAQFGFSKNVRGYMFSPRGPYHYGPGFSSIYAPAK
jgi:peptide/nickel transport system substrate-binding protein